MASTTPKTTKTPRVLSAASLEEIARLHRLAVRRLLRAEANALDLLKAPVDDASRALRDDLALQLGNGRSPRATANASLNARSRELEAGFAAATLRARSDARGHALEQVARETAPIREWATENGARPPPEQIGNAHAADVDAFEARRAAAGMATVWSSRGLSAFNEWERQGSDPATLAKSLNIAPALADRVGVHAAVQATTAYADEHRTYWRGAVPAANDNEPPESAEPLFPHGWESGLFKVWSAILDRRTCPGCHGLDGTMVPADKAFPGGVETPLHNLCRCIEIMHFVSQALSRKLPGMGIDYEALKEDVRDYYRAASARQTGVRHISEFLRGTQQRTAPETLIRKVRERRGYVKR